MDQRSLIALRTASAYGRQLVRLATNFLLVPFVLSRVGSEEYGLFQTVLSVTALLLVMELGMSEAVTRFVARESALQNEPALREVWLTSLIMYLVPWTIVLGVLLPASGPIASWLMPDSANTSNSTQLLMIAMCMLGLTFPALAYRGVLQGMQKDFWIALAEAVADLIRAGLIVACFLLWRADVVSILVITAATTIGTNLALALIVHGSFSWARFRAQAVRRDRVKSLLYFSTNSFIAQIGFLLNLAMHRLILSRVIGPDAVTAYYLASFLRSQIEEIAMRFTGTMTPVAAKYHGTGDRDVLRQLLLRGTKYSVLMVGLMAGPLAAFARPFLETWLWRTPQYADLAPLATGILAVGVLELTRGSSSSILVGMAEMRILAIVNLSTVVLDGVVATVLVLSTSLGIYSVLVSSALGVLVRRSIVTWHVCGVVDVPRMDLVLKSILRPLLPGLAAYAAGWLILQFDSGVGWVRLVGFGVLSGAVGVLVARLFVLSADERNDLLAPLAAALRYLRRPVPPQAAA